MNTIIQYLRKIYRFRILYPMKRMRHCDSVTDFFVAWKFGEQYPDTVFYFISNVSGPMSGLYSICLNIWSEIVFAQIMGWVPIIDESPHLVKKLKPRYGGHGNPLVRYYDFCNTIPYTSIYQASKVVFNDSLDVSKKERLLEVIGKGEEINRLFYAVDPIFDFDDSKRFFLQDTIRRNWKFTDQMQKELDESHRLIENKGRILGIAVREGKMFINARLKKGGVESDQPTIETIIHIAQKRVEEWNCDSIYLSCETPETIEYFTDAFCNVEVIWIDRKRTSMDEFMRCSSSFYDAKLLKKQADNGEQYFTDYIKDMYLLAQCNCMVCSENLGPMAVYLMSSKLETDRIEVLGRRSI